MILMRPGIDLTLTHWSVPISGPDKECVCILYNPLGTKSPYKDPLNHAYPFKMFNYLNLAAPWDYG